MTSISAQPPPYPPPVAGLLLYTTWSSKWKAVDNGRSNDVMHVVEFADLSNSTTPSTQLKFKGKVSAVALPQATLKKQL
jgi:hypothetical protein